MSVQVKTPTKTSFDRLEIQCGEKSFSSPEAFRRSKDDLSLKNDSRFSQPWNRKRRYSQSSRREERPMQHRKRLKSSPYFGKPLPSKFLQGGSIDDPLNLNSLDYTELGKELNSVTPQSSPLPVSVRRESIEVRIPRNVADPLALNLQENDDEKSLEERLFKTKKPRHNRHKKKDESVLFSPPKNFSKDKSLMEALKIDVDPESLNNSEIPINTSSMAKKDNQKTKSINDKIVSPVIRQTSPKSKKRRRTNSEGKPEPSSSTSRSLLQSPSISPVVKPDKKTPPKKFKHPKKPQPVQTKPGNKSMQKTHPKFVYGNYNRYYGYRNPSLEADHRLKCFQTEWFEGKSVLDIGCNVGHLTLTLARDYLPSKIVGIDIDQKLIAAARKNIRYYISSNVVDTSKFPISNILNYGPIVAPPVSSTDQSSFPNNVLFMQGNYVLECDELLDLQKEEYDVILALSVTKWIHFNWGDAGLKRFFKRIFKQLRPGGRLILEPQPWSSYKKKKKLTETIHRNFQAIRLRPEQFNDYLLSKEIGFSISTTFDVPMKATKGFRRPLLVFTKSDTVANSPFPDNAGYITPVHNVTSTAGFTTLIPVNEDHSEDSSCSCSTYSHTTADSVVAAELLSRELMEPSNLSQGAEDSAMVIMKEDSAVETAMKQDSNNKEKVTKDSSATAVVMQSSEASECTEDSSNVMS